MGQGGDDDTRRIILARRARFLAAALAGVAVAGTHACKPEPCLEPPYDPDAGGATDAAQDAPADGAPQPCLSIFVDSGVDSGADAEPQPCLAPPPGGDGG